MPGLREPNTLQTTLARFDKITPSSQRQWGKMTPAQMLVHCSTAFEYNLGDSHIKQSFLGKIFGSIAKRSLMKDEPFKQGLPTAPEFVAKGDGYDFDKEKQRLMALIKRMATMPKEEQAAIVHPFFGRMTNDEWDTLNYKHLDHHLRQFGA